MQSYSEKQHIDWAQLFAGISFLEQLLILLTYNIYLYLQPIFYKALSFVSARVKVFIVVCELENPTFG